MRQGFCLQEGAGFFLVLGWFCTFFFQSVVALSAPTLVIFLLSSTRFHVFLLRCGFLLNFVLLHEVCIEAEP